MRKEGNIKRRLREQRLARRIEIVEHVAIAVIVAGVGFTAIRSVALPKASAAMQHLNNTVEEAEEIDEEVQAVSVKSMSDIVDRAAKTMSYANYDKARDMLYDFTANLDDWCVATDRLDIDYLHTLTINGTVMDLCKTSNEINTNELVSHISVNSTDNVFDMWYNTTDDVYLISTPDDGFYNRYENNDEATQEFLQKHLMLDRAKKAILDTMTEVKRNAFKASISDITGSLEVTASGLLDDINLPTHYLNDSNDRYRVYLLVEGDMAYLYIHFDYMAASAQSEDYFYRLTRGNETFDMPEDINVNISDERVNTSVKEYLEASVSK